MNIFKSLGRTTSFKSNNAENWQKRDVELFFERIGLAPLTDSVFGKNNPLLTFIDSGAKLLSSFQTIRSNADTMLEARNSCASLYDPYSIYDNNNGSNSENSNDPKMTELQGLIGLFLQPSSSGGRSGSVIASSSPVQQNSNNNNNSRATSTQNKFDDLRIHSIVKQRLQNLDQLLKLKKAYEKDRKQDPNNDDASSSLEMGKKFDPEDENDFFMFQQNFIMDHLIASQFFRLEPKNGTKANSSLSRINVNATSEFIAFNENVTFNDLRKLYMQLNNLFENANHFNESFVEFEKNKGSKPLYITSSEKGGMFESTTSFDSVEFGFIGNDVDCRLLTTKQVIEFLRHKKIEHNCLKKVIEDNQIDGQTFVTLRHPLEWMILLFPSRNEIAEKGNRKNSPKSHPYEALQSLAIVISNIIRVICSNKFLLGGELKELKDFHV